jgi:RNA polymerase sigma-70 factor (ECF subfamily)
MVLEASMIHLGSKVNMISELDDIDELVRVYRSRVLRYVVYSIKDQDLAETITQDCFLKAYAGRASFRGDCSVSTWLMSIANNLMRDRLRTRKVQFWRKAAATSLDITEMAAFLPSGESTAENSLLARERLQRVVDALDELSVNQRAIFIMKFSEEMDPTEIAQAIGMPVNTVKTHLPRAITAIRKHLGNTV